MLRVDENPIHPSAEQLRAFGLGQSDPDTAAEIHRHLANCDVCLAMVESLPDDSLAVLVRSTAASLADTGPQRPSFAPDEPDALEFLSGHPRYRIEERVGIGGMGVVYRAQHLVMERTVALKLIYRQLTEKPAAVERFRREVKAAARLSHPNIVTAYDADQVGERHFLVMEFVPGITLAVLVQKQGPLPPAQACDFVRQAALGLQYAHEHGLVHRDIKPHNLMVTPEGQVKILDFGLARFDEDVEGGVTTCDAVMGSADFLAPEQADDPHRADIRSDIYSLGCTLYFLLAATPPFPNGNLVQKLKAHALREPPSVDKACPAAPAGLDGVVRRMLAKDPARRFQTPAEVARALAPFARGTKGGPHPRRRGPWQYWPAALVVLFALAALGGATVYRITSDYGELEITTNDPDVQLTFGQGGENVRAVDLRSQLSLSLRSGEYSVEGTGGGATVEVEPDRIVMKRGQKVTLTVKRHLLLEKRFESPGRIGDVALSPDGKFALTAEGNGNIRLWDVVKGLEIACIEGHTRVVQDVSFTSDSGQILSSSRDGAVKLWDVATRAEIRSFPGHDGEVWAARISPDGRSVLTGCKDKQLRLFDLATGTEKKVLTGHESAIDCAEFAPDSRRALSCGWDKTLRLWDLDQGQQIRSWRFDSNVRRIAWSRDGRRFLVGHADGRVSLWDTEGKKPIWSAQGHEQCVVYGVAFTPDDRFAVSSAGDARVCFWDAKSGKEVLRHHEALGEIYGLQISADGRRLLTNGGWSQAARLYRLPQGFWPVAKHTN